MATKTLITEEQFAALPDEEAGHHELVEGELVPLPTGSLQHNDVRDGLTTRLRLFVREHDLGVAVTETACRTLRGTIRVPDVSVYSHARLAGVDRKRVPLPLVPDIAVEVLSPSELALEVHRKVEEYLAAGCQEVWLLDTENRLIDVCTVAGVRRLRPDDTPESDLLPGFRALVRDVLEAR